jgi:uncharacterized membrane protein YtjA (UPF0391 family)
MPTASTGSPSQNAFVITAWRRIIMLYYAAVFFVIAIIAAIFGFGGIAAGAVEIAKLLFFVFLIVSVVALVIGLLKRSL